MFDSDDFMKSLKKDFKKIVEDRFIELNCDCGHKFKESIRRLQDDPKLTCPVCKTTLSINASELRDVLKSLGK